MADSSSMQAQPATNISKLALRDSTKLLCLNCRQSGHVVRDCRQGLGLKYSSQSWAYSPQRIELLTRTRCNADAELCSRCQKLDILSIFEGEPVWNSPSTDIEHSDYSQSPHHRNLGSVGIVEFYDDCPLCVGLFALIPNPWSLDQEAHLIMDWTIHRIERLVTVGTHSEHLFDKCLIADLALDGEALRIDEHEGDALTILRQPEDRLPLGGQPVNPLQLDLGVINSYLDRCNSHHLLSCKPKRSSALERAMLIDVETRRLIPFPSFPCDYLALSYVWGSTKPPKLNEDGTIPLLPTTLEDAQTLTAMLGKRYLWIDSICIDQADEGEKERQIDIMADIYRGSYATIISLCGSSSADGLTRVGSRRQSQPQLLFNVGSQQLISLMPTLSRQIAYNVWGKRAWTLQEALLSPRSLYITDHQVYWECNSTQGSESLDVTKSWLHNSVRDIATMQDNPDGFKLGHGTLRNATAGLGKPYHPVLTYGTLIALYSYRIMSDKRDALNAFAAILQHLTEVGYHHGFHYGLPEDDLNWSLLWCGLRKLRRRSQFPAWSWAGWEGAIHPGWPTIVQGPTQSFWTHFYAWSLEKGQPRVVFPHHTRPTRHLFETTTVFDVTAAPVLDNQLLLQSLASIDPHSRLLLDCLVWQTSLKLDSHEPEYDYGPFHHYSVHLNSVKCFVRVPHSTKFDLFANGEGGHLSFILTGREHFTSSGTRWVMHHFLHVQIAANGEATRQGIMHLRVPALRPEALDGLVVQRRSLVLN